MNPGRNVSVVKESRRRKMVESEEIPKSEKVTVPMWMISEYCIHSQNDPLTCGASKCCSEECPIVNGEER